MLKKTFLLALCLAPALPAGLLRIELSERSDVLAGKSFGAAGPYERLVGKAYFAVDPKLPANQIVVDIDKAPRNDSGLVEFSSDIYVLKPRDPKNGNGAVLYEVSNRGNKGMFAMYNRATSSHDPKKPADFGDNFLLERGYTLIWLGWQFDVPRAEGLMRLYTPIARNGDRPITGPVRSEIIVDKKEFSRSFADRNTHIPYPMANPNDPTLTLTVRDRNDGPRRIVPRSAWKIVEGTHVSMAAGFEPGKIYEIVYTAKDPALVGLGPAAIRDLISFLKFGNGNAATPLSDERSFIKRAYAMGTSQSGRFLRTFLYYGFNADEKGRKMFDGVLAHVAGAGRGSFNIRFGQPSRDGHPFLNLFYPTDIFPFTDVPETDPETGLTDGLLVKAEQAHVTPKIFYTDSAYEYWGRSASLIHTTPDGKKDAPIPAGTRIYFFAGGQHGPAAFPPERTVTTEPAESESVYLVDAGAPGGDGPMGGEERRAAAIAVSEDRQYKLVELSALRFPNIHGVAVPTRPQRAYHVDYGPDFRTRGIISIEPPQVGKPFPTLVPQVDADGNETSGIRMPDIQAPAGNLHRLEHARSGDRRAGDEMFSMVGSYIPFARTKAEREKNHDPRRSVEERYASREEYLMQVEKAAKNLVASGYLLAQDVPKLMERGSAEWDRLPR